MIGTIYWLSIVATVLANITALTIITLRFIPYPASARATGIIVICLVLFSLEHVTGLGDLYLILFPLTALSLYVMWHERERFRDETFRASEFVFLFALLYGAVWRLSSPEIVEDNDRLSDFHLVANYLSGEKLPPLDYWLPDQRLDYYYTFQHYSAALLGRIAGFGPGASFNLAAVILAALVVALAWEFLTILRVRFGLKLLSVSALAIGGTGLSPLFHLIVSPSDFGLFQAGSAYHDVFYNSRFIGWFETSVASDAWRTLLGETSRSILLPIETFGYQYALGGYHAVLSGFLLLFLALTLMVAVSEASSTVRPRLEFVLGLTVPLTLCCNAWVFPLQCALVFGWKVWDRLNGERDRYYLVGGVAAGTFLLLPFLAGLAASTGHMDQQLVALNDRAPLAQFLLLYWPLIVLAVAIPIMGMTKSLAGFLAALFLGLLIATEIFNVSDSGYGGEFIRFNPALKWWGWIFTGGVFSLAAFLMSSSRPVARGLAAMVLILVSLFVVDLGRMLVVRSHGFPGKIDGSGFYARDVANARMLEVLKNAPFGNVLENVYDERPIDTGIYGSFAQKPSVVGVPWILEVWKRDLVELPKIVADVKKFYAGDHPQMARFLADHDVRYIVWSLRESQDVAKWQSIMRSIESDFRWMEFSSNPDSQHVGLWIRR